MKQKRSQESLSSLDSTPGVCKDQDNIQVNNNTQTLVMEKEPNGYSEGRENSRGCSKRMVVPNEP